MQDVNIGSESLATMVMWMCIISVSVLVWCVYIWPVLVKVYWYAADKLYAVLYRNQMRTRR